MNNKLVAGIVLFLFITACFMPSISGNISKFRNISDDVTNYCSRDQILDLAVANVGDDDVSVLFGDGMGGFSDPQDYLVGHYPCFIVAGDFNIDGFLDLAVANEGGNTVSVLFGDGFGGFGDCQDYPVGDEPRDIVTGDFNMDGFLDLVLTHHSHLVGVILNDGTGGFGNPQFYEVEGEAYGIVAGDFNIDGFLDIAIAHGYYHISVIFGDGNGSFDNRLDCNLWPNMPYFLGVGDFNMDEALDIAFTIGTGYSVGVLLNNGSGGFGGPQFYGVAYFAIRIVAGDFNMDSYLDLAVTTYDYRVSVLLGDGMGGFGGHQDHLVGDLPWDIVAGDFNMDHILDLAVTNNFDNDVSVLLGDGFGGFGDRQDYPVGYHPGGIVAGDFNSAVENQPPDAPEIDGEITGTAGESYDYTFITTDLDDDDVWYYIEWGDGEIEDWIGPYPSGQEIVRSHTWDEQGEYTIRAKARDIFEEESDWAYLEITMPVNQQYQYPMFHWFLERFPNAFPILRHLLGL